MIQNHALGRAGGAGRIDDAGGVGVDGAFAGIFQCLYSLCGRFVFVVCVDFVNEQQIVFRDIFQLSGQFARGDNPCGTDVLQDGANAGGRVFDVEIHVGIAGIQNAEVGDDQFNTFGQKDGDDFLRLPVQLAVNVGGKTQGMRPQRGKGNCPFIVMHGNFFGVLAGSLLEIRDELDVFHVCKPISRDGLPSTFTPAGTFFSTTEPMQT